MADPTDVPGLTPGVTPQAELAARFMGMDPRLMQAAIEQEHARQQAAQATQAQEAAQAVRSGSLADLSGGTAAAIIGAIAQQTATLMQQLGSIEAAVNRLADRLPTA